RINHPRGAILVVNGKLEERQAVSRVARLMNAQLHELGVNCQHRGVIQSSGELMQIRWPINIEPISPLRGRYWRRACPAIACLTIGRYPALGHPFSTFHPADAML